MTAPKDVGNDKACGTYEGQTFIFAITHKTRAERGPAPKRN
jgi:hypothetical protein